MKMQIERSLQEAGAINLSAGLSRPDRGFCKQSEAGHGRQECYSESATTPCADHCKTSWFVADLRRGSCVKPELMCRLWRARRLAGHSCARRQYILTLRGPEIRV